MWEDNMLEQIENKHNEYIAQNERFNNFQRGVKDKFQTVTNAVTMLVNKAKNETTSTESGLSAIFTYYKLIRDLSYNIDSTIDRMYLFHDKAIEDTDFILSFLNYLISIKDKGSNRNSSSFHRFNPIPKGINSNYTITGVKAQLEPMITVVSTAAGITEFGIDSINASRTKLGKIGGGILTAGAGALTLLLAWAESQERQKKFSEESAEIIKAIDSEQKLIQLKIRYVNKGIEKISLLNTSLSLFFSYFDSTTMPSYLNILNQGEELDNKGRDVISDFINKMKESISKVEAMQYSSDSHPVRSETPESVIESLDYLARSSLSDAQDAIQIPKRLNTILENYIPTTLEEANKSIDERRFKRIWSNISTAIIVIGVIILLIFIIKLLWPVIAFIWSVISAIFGIAIEIIKGIFSLVGSIFSIFFG